jgi:hypothetical protein
MVEADNCTWNDQIINGPSPSHPIDILRYEASRDHDPMNHYSIIFTNMATLYIFPYLLEWIVKKVQSKSHIKVSQKLFKLNYILIFSLSFWPWVDWLIMLKASLLFVGKFYWSSTILLSGSCHWRYISYIYTYIIYNIICDMWATSRFLVGDVL